MAEIKVVFDGTLLSGAESESDGGVWDIWGKSTSPQQEGDFVYQGTYSISNKVSGGTGGVEFEDDGTVDYTTPKVVLAKVLITTTGIVDLTVPEGASYQIGESGTVYWNYYIFGLYAGPYPKRGGWLILPIDPNEAAWRDERVGASNPDLTVVDYYGWWADITGSAKAENVVHDRLDVLTNGTGLTLDGGSSSLPATFQDFIDADEGTQLDSYGVVSTGESEIVTNGVLTIGTSTTTVFSASNFVVVFPTGRVGEGFFGIDVNLSDSGTDVDFTAGTFKSLGNASTKKFFDTALQLDAGADTATISNHGFSTGDFILYSKEGGVDTTGLTDGTNYFVRAVDDNTISFYAVEATSTGRQDSFTDTGREAITVPAIPGENHSVVRLPDTRADHTVTNTSGAADWTACSIDGARAITFTSGCAMTGGFIIRVGDITLSTGTVTGVTILDQTTSEGDALFTQLTTLNGIVECEFTSGDEGHAMEIISTGSTNSDANLFTDYWQPTISGSDNGWEFHTQDGVDAGTEVITTNAAHGFTTGDAVYYNDEGGSDSIGLIDGYKYYVNVASTTTFTVHYTRAAAVAGSSDIDLNQGGTGETHAMYSGNAVVFNDSGGAVTINVLNGGDGPSVRNGTGASTTVVNTKTLTVTCLNTSGIGIENVRVRIEASSDGSLISEGLTNSSGVYVDSSYAFTVEVAVNIIARLKGFRFNKASDTITASGLSVPFTMIKDAAVNLP
jgi:hypothetical protein